MLERIDKKHVVFLFDYKGVSEIAILKTDDDKFDLTWTDYIINVWTETFDDLSTAMLRAAALIKCGETDWDEGFKQSPEEFTNHANDFFNITVTTAPSKSREETK